MVAKQTRLEMVIMLLPGPADLFPECRYYFAFTVPSSKSPVLIKL